jgi:hypothetical protein
MLEQKTFTPSEVSTDDWKMEGNTETFGYDQKEISKITRIKVDSKKEGLCTKSF